jgi:hypothetical protein
MICTNGTQSTFATYRVTTRVTADNIRRLNINKGEQIAAVTVDAIRTLNALRTFCYETSKKHATPEWPAFEWNV